VACASRADAIRSFNRLSWLTSLAPGGDRPDGYAPDAATAAEKFKAYVS
jgi:hypothetical protein